MAKKDLASLMNSIMGQQDIAAKGSEVNTGDSATTGTEPQTSAPTVGRRRVGRPRKGETVAPPNEIRATFIVAPEIVRNLKYIALVESKLFKEVIADALYSYLNEWEKKNGRIKLPNTK